MTKKELEILLVDIEIAADSLDYEVAHKLQDRLLRNVITGIANGNVKDPKDICCAVLKVYEIEFCRWYA